MESEFESWNKTNYKVNLLKPNRNNLPKRFYFLSIKISIQINNSIIDEKLIGVLHSNFSELNQHMRQQKYKILRLNAEPKCVCALPNGNLAIVSYKQQNISIYDINYNQLQTIELIDRKPIKPYCMVTNNRDRIYICDRGVDCIFQTDLDFNLLHQYGANCRGDSIKHFNKPSGMDFYERSLFICDLNNKRIQKLSENLVFEDTFKLNIEPWQIMITNNVACVRPYNSIGVYFYDLRFQLKRFIDKTSNGPIYKNNGFFYKFDIIDINIQCFDLNGNISNDFKLNHKNLFNFEYDASTYFIYHFKEIIVTSEKSKKLLVIC